MPTIKPHGFSAPRDLSNSKFPFHVNHEYDEISIESTPKSVKVKRPFNSACCCGCWSLDLYHIHRYHIAYIRLVLSIAFIYLHNITKVAPKCFHS